MQILLSRTHFNVLAVGAADVSPQEIVRAVGTDAASYGRQSTGWVTPFDGGRDTRAPGTIVALAGDSGEGVIYALVQRVGPGRELARVRCRAYELRLRDGEELSPLAEAELLARFGEERGRWMATERVGLPEWAGLTLDRVILTVAKLFGQGGDFFEW